MLGKHSATELHSQPKTDFYVFMDSLPPVLLPFLLLLYPPAPFPLPQLVLC
jgi:hypothetical protein